MNNRFSAIILALSVAVFGVAPQVLADPTRNPPLVCAAKASCSTCPTKDGCACGCILVTLDLGATTAWTGQTPVYLRIHSSDETASLSTPAQLKVVMGWSFKAVDGGTTAGGAPQIVRFVQPEGAELVVHFQDGDSVGVPEPNNLGKSLARVQMVDAEGWATTSAPAFYDLYPGDGSVWRFLATGNTNERGALVSFTDPRGRVLTPDDFGVDIVRDVLGNIRQVKTLTRLADVRTLSPTHYAVTVYPLTEEPEQVADTGLYALPEHAPTRVLDVAQGESVKELLVGFQKGTGDMRQYRYVAVNGDWTLHQPSGLVEAQELYFTEDESGAQRLHTIRDETGKLWSRDEYNYVSAYWGYLITNRIEGIPGDATRTTSWSYYTDGPHKDLLRETVEPTGNRILYEYDDKNRVVRESMPLVEEETLYSYEPVDPSDPPLLCDTRPRCVVRKMQGIEIQRTYYVYGTNGVDVVERVGEQGAAYGGTNVLRTVTTYYPVTGAITDGLVQSVRHEDGTIDNYAYGLTDGVWTETITHVHEQAPDIVPMRTTRSVRVYNALGQLIDSRTDLCTIGVEDLIPQADWTPIERMQYAYDIDGNEIRREDLAGRFWTAEWAGNCCGKVSEIDEEGISTLFSYDEDGQIILEKRLFPKPHTIETDRDRLGRVVSISTIDATTEEIVATDRVLYDVFGRIVKKSRSDGISELFEYAYSNGLQVVSSFEENATGMRRKQNIAMTDHNGSPVVWIDQDRKVETHTEYEPLKQRETVHDELGKTRITRELVFDMLGRTIRDSVPAAQTGFLSRIQTFGNTFRPETIKTLFSPTLTVPDGDTTDISSTFLIDLDGYRGRLEISDNNLNGLVDWNGEDQIFSNTVEFVITDGALFESFRRFEWCFRNGWVWHEVASSISIVPGYHLKTIAADCVSYSIENTAGALNVTNQVFVNRETHTTVIRKKNPIWAQPLDTIFQSGFLISESTDGINGRQFGFDCLGRPEWVRTEECVTNRFQRNERGLIVREFTGESLATEYSYDEWNRLVEIKNADNRIRHYEYDMLDRVVLECGDVYPTRYNYDSFDQLIEVQIINETNAVPNQSGAQESEYAKVRYLRESGMGLISEIVLPGDRHVFFEYTPIGKISRKVSSRGVVVTYSYDRNGHLCKKSYSDGTPSVCYNYTPSGALIKAVVEGGVTNEWTYRDGFVASETTPFGNIQYSHDRFGRMIERQYSFGDIVRILTIGYNEQNNISEFTVGDDVFRFFVDLKPSEMRTCEFGPHGQFKKIISFNSRNRMVESVTNLYNGEPLSAFIHERSISGVTTNRIVFGKFIENECRESFQYNQRGELVSTDLTSLETNETLMSFTYRYDGNGNRHFSQITRDADQSTKTMTFADNGQLTSVLCNSNGVVQTCELVYDNDGNCLFDGMWHYDWDAENRLKRISNNATNPTLEACFVYDALDRPVICLETIYGKQQMTKMTWDRFNLVREEMFHENGTNVTEYFWGIDKRGFPVNNGSEGLLEVIKDGMVFYPCEDANGNILHYCSSGGNIVESHRFGPFGEVLDDMNESVFSLWFSSQRYKWMSASWFFLFRQYNSAFGRFMSPDPVETPFGVRPYLYIGNAPVDSTDLLGLMDMNCCKRLKNEAINGEPRIKTLYDELKTAKKAINSGSPVVCLKTMQCTERVFGKKDRGDFAPEKNPFVPGGGIINLYFELNEPEFTVETAKYTLLHELQHAAEWCYDSPGYSCEDCLKEEIRAFYCSGRFSKETEIVKHLEETGYFSRYGCQKIAKGPKEINNHAAIRKLISDYKVKKSDCYTYTEKEGGKKRQ